MKYIEELCEALKIAAEEMKEQNVQKITIKNLIVNLRRKVNNHLHYNEGGFSCPLVKDNGKKFKVVLCVKYKMDHKTMSDDYTKESIIAELSNNGTYDVKVRCGFITIRGNHINITA